MAKAPTTKKVAAKAAPSTTRKSGMIRTLGPKATLGKRAT